MPTDPGIPASQLCSVPGLTEQNSKEWLFPQQNNSQSPESHSPQFRHLCGNLDLGHSSGRKNVHAGDRWVPAKSSCSTGLTGRPEPQGGPGVGTWAGRHAPVSGCSYAKSRSSSTVGRHGKGQVLGEPRVGTCLVLTRQGKNLPGESSVLNQSERGRLGCGNKYSRISVRSVLSSCHGPD